MIMPGTQGLNVTEAVREPKPGEYRRADGLICCEKCGQPVQFRMNSETFANSPDIQRLKENPEKYQEWASQWLGTFPIACKCGEERFKRMERLQRQQEQQRRVEANRRQGLNARVASFTFSADKRPNSKPSQIARRYADKFEAGTKKYSLLFCGASGTGKTFTAGCIANELTNRGLFVYFLPIRDALTVDKGRGWAETLEEIRRCDLLILDDLEAIDRYGYEADYILQAIDARQDTARPFIITTTQEKTSKSERGQKLRTRLESTVRIPFAERYSRSGAELMGLLRTAETI